MSSKLIKEHITPKKPSKSHQAGRQANIQNIKHLKSDKPHMMEEAPDQCPFYAISDKSHDALHPKPAASMFSANA
jgi:hypothetical protein